MARRVSRGPFGTCGDRTIPSIPQFQQQEHRTKEDSEALMRRSEEKKQRSEKRNLARSNQRTSHQNETAEATAQDPRHGRKNTKTKTQFRLKRQHNIATINIRGNRQGIAITEVEQWMTKTKTDYAGIQETYVGANKQSIKTTPGIILATNRNIADTV